MGLLLDGARKMAKTQEERKLPYQRATDVAIKAFEEVGEDGVSERELIGAVQRDAEVVREIAVYVVSELCSDGLARREKEGLRLFHVRRPEHA